LQERCHSTVSIELVPTEKMSRAEFIESCRNTNWCMPRKPTTKLFDWQIVVLGIESEETIHEAKLMVLLCLNTTQEDLEKGDIRDIVLRDTLQMTTQDWYLYLNGRNVSLKPNFFLPIGIVQWPEYVESPDIGDITAVPAWLYGQEKDNITDQLHTTTQSIVYVDFTQIALTTSSSIYNTANVNHITEMHYCNQILLRNDEYQLLYNNQILHIISTNHYLYLGQFKVHKDAETRKVVGVYVCIENTHFKPMTSLSRSLHMTTGIILFVFEHVSVLTKRYVY